MKRNLILSFLLLLCTWAGAFSQITITRTDVQTTWNLGNAARTNLDTMVTQVNIGQPGATSWNFGTLASHFSFVTTQVDPASTPYGGNYPGATHARYSNGIIPGFTSESWGYASLSDSNALFHGGVSTMTIVPGMTRTTYEFFAPLEIELHLPVTLGSSWQYSGVETDISWFLVPPPDTVVSTLNVVVTVDAYGTMTLPGGNLVSALRLRRDERRISSLMGYSRSITYIFVARTGESVVVETNDTVSTGGTIPVEGVTWMRGPVMPSVGMQGTSPGQFALLQNYPNPFNPMTNFRFSLPSREQTSLRVYDVLGREVATLVNEVKQPGTYTVRWEPNGLASGVYLCRLQAGSSVATRKLVIER